MAECDVYVGARQMEAAAALLSTSGDGAGECETGRRGWKWLRPQAASRPWHAIRSVSRSQEQVKVRESEH